MSVLSSLGNTNFVLPPEICPVYTVHPSKGLLTEEADGAAVLNFSMKEVWETTTDQ